MNHSKKKKELTMALKSKWKDFLLLLWKCFLMNKRWWAFMRAMIFGSWSMFTIHFSTKRTSQKDGNGNATKKKCYSSFAVAVSLLNIDQNSFSQEITGMETFFSYSFYWSLWVLQGFSWSFWTGHVLKSRRCTEIKEFLQASSSN